MICIPTRWVSMYIQSFNYINFCVSRECNILPDIHEWLTQIIPYTLFIHCYTIWLYKCHFRIITAGGICWAWGVAMSPFFLLWISIFINLNRTPRFMVWILYCCASVIFFPTKFEGKHTFFRTFCSSVILSVNTQKSVAITITTYLEALNITSVFIV